MKITLRRSFLLYVLWLTLAGGAQTTLCLLCTLLIHEGAHLLVTCLFHESVAGIELTPFGGLITRRCGCSAYKGVRGFLIAAAGVAANYTAILLISICPFSSTLPNDIQKTLLITNATMFLLNLLPALPLDGGRMLFSVGYYLFPIASLSAVLTASGVFAGILMMLLAVYGVLCHQMLNISLLAVGAYLIVCAQQEREGILCENLYAVIQEKRQREDAITAVRLLYAPPQTPLIRLLPHLSGSKRRICLMIKPGLLIGEAELMDALLRSPQSALGDVLVSK